MALRNQLTINSLLFIILTNLHYFNPSISIDMLKNYLPLAFIFFLFVIGNTSAQLTYVPDDGFEQALIDLGYDDVLDNYVLTASINHLLELDVNGEDREESKKIVDLTGIEDFTSLTSLNCNTNKLTSLDLSSNLTLTDVRCKKNDLTSLNITENKLLISVTCSSNQLTSLDLNKNTELLNVWCFSNQLASLDVSKNPMLTKLHSFNNPLLSCIQVNEEQLNDIPADWRKDESTEYSLNCSTSIYTHVPDDFFEQELINLGYDDILDDYVLTSNINEVTDLRLISDEIRDLTGIDGFRALQDFNSSYLHLKNLDLSKNINLTRLKLSECDIGDLNISKNVKLTYLSLDESNVYNLDLTNNIALEKLALNSVNDLVTLDLTKNIALKSLYMLDIVIPEIDLTKNIALEKISMEFVFLSSLDLSQNKNLESLSLTRLRELNSLNVKNGNNTEMNFFVLNNRNLTCVQVDDVAWSTANWEIEPPAFFSENCLALGVDDEILAYGLNLYPNPVSNTLIIDSKLPLEKVEVFSILGQRVKEVISNFNTISIDNLSNGIYIIKIYTENGSAVKRIIKQ